MGKSKSRSDMKTVWKLLKTMHEDLVSGNSVVKPCTSVTLVDVITQMLTSVDHPCTNIPESCSHCHTLLMLTNIKLMFESDSRVEKQQFCLEKDFVDSPGTDSDWTVRDVDRGRDGSGGSEGKTMGTTDVDGKHLSWKEFLIASVGIDTLITWLLGLLKSSRFVRYEAVKAILSGFKGHVFHGHEEQLVQSVLKDLTCDHVLHPTACLDLLRSLVSHKSELCVNRVTVMCLKSYFNTLCSACWEQGTQWETSHVKLQQRHVDSETGLNTDREVGLKMVELKADSKVDLEADSKVDLEADSKVDLKADSNVDFKADSKVDLKTHSKVDLKTDSNTGLQTNTEIGLSIYANVGPDTSIEMDTDFEVRLKTDYEVELKKNSEMGLKIDTKIGLNTSSEDGLKTDPKIGTKTKHEKKLTTGSKIGLNTNFEDGLKTDSRTGPNTDTKGELKTTVLGSEARLAFLCVLQKVVKYFNRLDESEKLSELQGILPFVSDILAHFLFSQTYFTNETPDKIQTSFPSLQSSSVRTSGLEVNYNDSFTPYTCENFSKPHIKVSPYLRLLYKKVIDIFNTILCYGHDLAQRRGCHRMYLHLSVVLLSQVSQTGLGGVPYSSEFVGFGGPEMETEKSSGDDLQPGDTALLRKLFLLLFKMCAVCVKSAHKDLKPDVCMQLITNVLRDINMYVTDHLDVTSGDPNDLTWLPLVFHDQDDAWIETLLCLLDIYLALTKNHDADTSLVNSLNPHRLFLQFLDSTTNDHTVLVDLLTSPETCFLLYLVRYLKYVLREWDKFVGVCHSTYCCQDYQNKTYSERVKQKSCTSKPQSQKCHQSLVHDTLEFSAKLTQGNEEENISFSSDAQSILLNCGDKNMSNQDDRNSLLNTDGQSTELSHDGPNYQDKHLVINTPQDCVVYRSLKRKADELSLVISEEESFKNWTTDAQSENCKKIDQTADSHEKPSDRKRPCHDGTVLCVKTNSPVTSLPDVCPQMKPLDGLHSLAFFYGDDDDGDDDDSDCDEIKTAHLDHNDNSSYKINNTADQSYTLDNSTEQKSIDQSIISDSISPALVDQWCNNSTMDKTSNQSNTLDTRTDRKSPDQNVSSSCKTEQTGDQNERADTRTDHKSIDQNISSCYKMDKTEDCTRLDTRTYHESMDHGNSSKTNPGAVTSGGAACGWRCVDRVLATFIRLRLKIARLHEHGLFPYNPRPLLSVLQRCEDRYELLAHHTH